MLYNLKLMSDYKDLLPEDELDELPVVCVLKDHYSAFVFANRQTSVWFPQPIGGYRGKTDYHLMGDKDASVVRQNDKHVLSTGEELETVEYIHKDGQLTAWLVVKFLIEVKNKKFVGVISTNVSRMDNDEEWDVDGARVKLLQDAPHIRGLLSQIALKASN